MMWALILDGRVHEITDVDPAGRYHPLLDWRACPEDVEPGWSDDWSPPVAPVQPAVDLTAYAADKRWRIETGGITVGGVPVATDDRSKTMIMGARIKADADPNYTVGWKTEAGFVTLNATQIVAISDAVLAHVDACFDAEAAVLAGIDAGNIATIAAIDAFDWPPN